MAPNRPGTPNRLGRDVAGELRSLRLQDESEPLPLSAGLCWYNSSDGLDAPEGEDRGQAGGAYIFR